ncbi:MAG: peptide MFS transporter [Phycisphaerae bacterium]
MPLTKAVVQPNRDESTPPARHDEFLGHPKGLFVLFFAELWERFSYYGMRALLVLYMVKALQYADARATSIYGAYIGFVYATPLVGGMLADRFLGYRKAIFLGGSLMVLGHFAMAIEMPIFFYGAMGLIITGNGFFKPNISTMVGSLYDKGDPRRDGAFTIFYMGINVGAFLAGLACGYVGEEWGWHYGFALAGIGMVGGLTVFVRGQKHLGTHGLPPRPEALGENVGGIPKTWLIYLGIIAFVPLAGYLLTQPTWVQYAVYTIGPLMVIYVIGEALRCEPGERGGLFVLLVLIFFSITFWACFEQAGSSMTLFTDRHVDRHFMGWNVPVTWFQSINPAFIVLLSIPFSMLWLKLGKANLNPSASFKFSLALLQMAGGFVAMVIAAQSAKDGGQAHLLWVVLAYFLHTSGELCLSPVGLSTVTKLSPVRLCGLMMGMWFLSNAFAGVLSGQIAAMTGKEAGYSEVFQGIVYFAGAAGVLLLVLTLFLRKVEQRAMAHHGAR